MTRLRIDNGRITLPAGIARELATSDLALASWSGRHLLLGHSEVLLAGKLGEIAVADLLSFVNMFRKSGIMHFSLPDGAKDLVFVNGEIVHAASTVPEEDLGEFLSAGVIDRELLIKMRQRAGGTPGELRRLLIDGGLVPPKEIWAATLTQIETIIYNLIPAPSGAFAFLKGGEVGGEELQGVVLSTQNLIMEGLRRSDERLLFLRRIPSLDGIPLPTGRPDANITPAEERILALAQPGRATVREVIARSGVSELEGLRLCYHLIERQLLTIDPPRTQPVSPEIGSLMAIMNGALAELCRKISPRNHGFVLELRCFLRDLPQPYSHVFRHVSVSAEGTIDSERVAANLAGLEEGEGRRLLVEAMDELLFMACHAARRDLGEADSAALVQRVREIGRRARQLIERKNG